MRHAGFSCLDLEVIRVIFTHRPLVKAVYTLPNYLEVRLGNTGAHVAYLVSTYVSVTAVVVGNGGTLSNDTSPWGGSHHLASRSQPACGRS